MTVDFNVRITYDPAKVKPRGPVEQHDDGTTDIDAVVTGRICNAFNYVEGFEPDVKVTRLMTHLPLPEM